MADTLGGKIGTRVAEINTRAKMAAAAQLSPLFVRTGMALQEEFFRLTGFEVQRTLGPVWRKIATAEGSEGWVADTAHFIADGKGQFATFLAARAGGEALGGGVLSLITNELNAVVLPLIAKDPNGIISAEQAATAYARGLANPPYLANIAHMNAIDDPQFRILRELSLTRPGLAEIADATNRGIIGENYTKQLLTRAGYSPDDFDLLTDLFRRVPAAADAVNWWNRGIVDQETALAIARRDGVEKADALRALEAGGEPPDLTTLLLAWRRGIITEAQVDRAIKQGPIRFEWIPAVKALQWEPLPPAEAADAVNQGHIDYAKAESEARLSGVRPEHFRIMVDDAGLPPGPQEALDWLNRGILTESEFTQAFLESRIKNKYVGLYLKARYETMPPETVRLMYARGAMTREQALHRLQVRGYTAEDAAIIIDGASAEKTQTERDLTKAELISLYTDRAISADDATAGLVAQGYEPAEAAQLLLLADLRRWSRFFTAALNRTHSAYVARKIDEGEASAAMDALGVTVEARDEYLILWDIERQVATKELTTAEVIAAAKLGLFGVDEALNRLQGQGYSQDDAVIKLQIAKIIPVGQ